jgi:alpha-glucosidase/alpha-D-xyloside xylohydrolase
MRSGQGGFELRTHLGRVPIPWIIGTSGWAIFIHQPFGTFDFSVAESKFQPPGPGAARPLDIFFIAASEPGAIMAEYARMTGHPQLPPLWSFVYQQSHRTRASREEILRERILPCDTVICLGTGFCPSGWNTNNGEFEFNRKVFLDPKAIFDELHGGHSKVALCVVIKAWSMHGTVQDPCDPKQPLEEQPSCYWNEHRGLFALGVDGWSPDEGDLLDPASRLTRNRMYWDVAQIDLPTERPFALHRNGYAGMQHYASFLWSGDVYSTWETLRTHLPVAINTGLSGIRTGERTAAGSFRPRNLRPSCMSVGFSLDRSARCSARTAATGSSGFPGDGTPAIRAQSKSATTMEPRFRTQLNCTTRKSNRSAGNSAIGCCLISIALCASPRSRDCR